MNSISIIAFVIFLSLFTLAYTKFTVAVMNDVHLDLKYNPSVIVEDFCQNGGRKTSTLAPYGRKGCDSPYSLFISSLEKLKSVNPHPDLMLVPGDIVTHAIPRTDGKFDPLLYQQLKYVVNNYTDTVSQMFPETPILFTQGNDDYVINYQVPDTQHKFDYYQFMYQKIITDIKANKFADTPENREIYLQTGCYTMELQQGLLLISINSMHFSIKNNWHNDPESPARIWTWFAETLKNAKQKNLRVILIYHIPHGSFLTPVGSEKFWTEDHEAKLRVLLKQYADIISAIFAGHIHISALDSSNYDSNNSPEKSQIYGLIDEIFDSNKRNEMLNQKNFYAGMVVNRAITPLFVNNPGFSLFYYIDTFDFPKYYEEYSFELPATYNKTDPADKYWFYLYHSMNDLQIKDMSSKGIQDFLDSLVHDLTKFLKYMLYKLGEKPREIFMNKDRIELFKSAFLHYCSKITNDMAEKIMCFDSLKEKFNAMIRN